MAEIKRVRWTARQHEPFVVFLIGMRFNRLWKLHKLAPVLIALPRMLAELSRRPELGYLNGHVWFGRTTLIVQYWRSIDDLAAYARDRESQHLPAWRDFNKAVGENGDVGIFHETYPIVLGAYESVYANMPATLLDRVGKLTPAEGLYKDARSRLGAHADLEADVAEI